MLILSHFSSISDENKIILSLRLNYFIFIGYLKTGGGGGGGGREGVRAHTLPRCSQITKSSFLVARPNSYTNAKGKNGLHDHHRPPKFNFNFDKGAHFTVYLVNPRKYIIMPLYYIISE